METVSLDSAIAIAVAAPSALVTQAAMDSDIATGVARPSAITTAIEIASAIELEDTAS